MPFAARQGFFSQPAAAGNARRTGAADTNTVLTYTANSAVTKTAVKEFGTASMYVETSSGRIQTSTALSPKPTFMDYGTGDFCIEWWMYIESPLNTHNTKCDVLTNEVSGGFGMRLAQANGTNGLNAGANAKYINVFAREQADLDYWDISTNGGTTWQADQWYFCVMQRKGGVPCFWLDGSLKTNTATSTAGNTFGTRNFASCDNQIFIGYGGTSNEGAGPFYIDEICFSTTWRYEDTTADIPVPSAPFTVDEYTGQLLHMDGSNDGTTFENDGG